MSAVTTAGLPATSGTTQSAGSLRITATNTTGCLDIGTSGVLSWLQACRRTNLADNFDIALNPNGGNVGIGVAPVTGVATLPGEGLFIAYAYTNASNPSAFTSYAVILCDSVGSRVIANNGTQISITTSTFALQVTQIFSATLNVAWSFVQLG